MKERTAHPCCDLMTLLVFSAQQVHSENKPHNITRRTFISYVRFMFRRKCLLIKITVVAIVTFSKCQQLHCKKKDDSVNNMSSNNHNS